MTVDNGDSNRDGRASAGESLYEHVRHPWAAARREASPVKIADMVGGFNDWLALKITRSVGTMWCAYAFGLMDLFSLPQAIHNGLASVITWVAQTFLQLVLLSIIIVGQNIQGRAADRRSEQVFQDAEAILHECLELQQHLMEQDRLLTTIHGHTVPTTPLPPSDGTSP
jgi:hypothetical protein